MDELAAIKIFAKVAESKSFSTVARQFDMSVSSISRQINSLETSLGVRLLNRTTRQLALTEAGEHYYKDISKVLQALEEAKIEASAYQDSIRGRIRVHACNSAGAEILVPALPDFLKQFPEVVVDITLTDERVDLVAEKVDIALWLGNLDDSSMVARRVSPSHRVVVGSPDYFSRYGVPKKPEDLEQHNCLVYSRSHYLDEWRFLKDGQTVRIPVSGNLKTSTAGVLMTSAKQGLGLAVMQEWSVRAACAQGLLKTVLTDYDVHPTDYDTALYLVYPHRQMMPSKIRAFINFLMPLFAYSEN